MPDAEQRFFSTQIDDRMSNVTVYIVGAIVVCLVTVLAVTIVAVIRPESTVIATIIGVTTPISMALLAAGLQGVHKGVNGRLSQLLHRTAEASHASGRAEAIKQLYFRQQQLDPASAEHATLADQIRRESMSYFEVVEKRAPS